MPTEETQARDHSLPDHPYPGEDYWNRAGEIVADPAFRCSSYRTERICYMGGGDPI